MNRVNLFIIGVNKCGTNWLYHLLSHHPDVFMSERKEMDFFNDYTPAPSSLEAYHAYFPFQKEYKYFGEASAHYYDGDQTPREIHRYNPEAKLLAIVRDPIDRLHSQYRYFKQLGHLDEDISVEEAIEDRTALLRCSHYENTLPRFADQFGPDHFKIVSLEEGKEHPTALWQELLTYLDLPVYPYPTSEDAPKNPTGSPAFRWVYRNTARPLKRYAPGLFQWMLQSALVRNVKLGLIHLLGTAGSSSLPKELKIRLRKEFAPTYTYLEEQGFDIYPTD